MKTAGIVGCSLMVAFAWGCANTHESRQADKVPVASATAAVEAQGLPAPAAFHIAATLNLTLTPQLSTQYGLPQMVTATVEADAHAEAISGTAPRARHVGHLKLVVTAGQGKQALANMELELSGEGDGSPTDGLGLVMKRFVDAATFMSPRNLQPSGAAAPGTQPADLGISLESFTFKFTGEGLAAEGLAATMFSGKVSPATQPDTEPAR